MVLKAKRPGPRNLAHSQALSLVAVLIFLTSCDAAQPVTPSEVGEGGPLSASLSAVPFTDVGITDKFWAPKLVRNRDVTLPHLFAQNRETGRIANFERAAGLRAGSYEGRRFNDTDIYKTLEAASYALELVHDEELDGEVDELITLLAAAQENDGYLFPALTVDPRQPAKGVGKERWQYVGVGSHELYNAGHLIEAAVAHFRATGKRTLLDMAVRFADLIDRDFGADARIDIPGHEEIELALVKLADVTGERRYLELARFFLDQRGGELTERTGDEYPGDTDFSIYNDRTYKQDHLPVVEQRKASGHAVRATYLYTAMADVAARDQEAAASGYDEALESIWQDVVRSKMYLTGGIGSRGTFESFGEDYELPNASAYSESCAAVGHEMWNHRMFLRTADTRYADVMERVLYNALLAGVSQRGDTFFYTNPLASDGSHQREPYFEVACCPANLSRTFSQLPGLVYARRGSQLWVLLYVGSEATVELEGGTLHIKQETDYPWDGKVRLTVERVPGEGEDDGQLAELEVVLRIPGWAREEPVPSDLYRYATVSAALPTFAFGDGATSAVQSDVPLPLGLGALDANRPGAQSIRSTFARPQVIELELPMPVRQVIANEAVEEDRGRVALQRGPLVYAFEQVDNGVAIDGLELRKKQNFEPQFREGLLGGVAVLENSGGVGVDAGVPAKTLVAVPYFSWANREAGAMAVWVKRAGS